MRPEMSPQQLPFVLMYHSIGAPAEDPHRITVSPARFASQMAWLDRRGLRGISMRALLDATARGSAGGLVGLTFDDGYADFSDVVPVLARYGFGATAFVVAGRLGGHNEWDRDAPAKPLLSAEQVREIASDGIEVGSHGLRHRCLAGAGPDVLHAELRHSKDVLEQLLGTPVVGFSYPYGEHGDAAMTAAESHGYSYAVATRPTALRHRFALPRTYVGDSDGPARLYLKHLRHRLTWAGRR